MRQWTLCVEVALLIGLIIGALSGCGHNPNHGIDMGEAKAAAARVHKPPPPGVKMEPVNGG
jgi:hypothetical protein